MSDARIPTADDAIPWLRDLVAERLGIASTQIDPDERLHRYGLTSLTAAAVIADIAAKLGRALPPTLVWDYPTLRRLAGFLDGSSDTMSRPPPVRLAPDDPIAIIGMACRFPGAESPSAFWRMLVAGTDAIREVPPDRWPLDALYDPDPQAPGRMSTRWGGFLDSIDGFDADFFGMSPREAAQTDPQQRLALELAWEALEDAGIRPKRLGGSRTGVFMGAMWSDYARLLQDRDAIAQHTATGQDTSIVSARIAYVLGLEGPALTINTACSSALVAVHQACGSLRSGESTVALAGGVHLLLAPESSIAMTKFGAMAPDGRCKTFDSRANGYVRGEGGGIVVLKPLSSALSDGDRIYAVIRGSAMNNDGPSNGLTAPNPSAQRTMLQDALANAGIDPLAVDYVEAHGTGTALGDPIEANALAACLCRDRPAGRKLRIGSVKTNIGHLEAAAGAAGLIKLALSLHHRWIPASLHFAAPNPAIDFDAANMMVQSEGGSWPTGQSVPTGGVSSFGFGGTNCHVLLQAAPPRLPHARSLSQARPVFVFAGNGGNWPGMARALLAEPAFAASLHESDAILSGLGYPASVIQVLTVPDDRRIEDVALGQPALCAFQLALVALLAETGLHPAAVIGHSVGEAAAAAAAGILAPEDALRLVVARSRLQARVAGQGRMALAGAAADAVRRHLPDDAVIAGENGPRATLLSGTPSAIEAACCALDAAGIVCHPIQVPVAYHSPHMDALRPLLEAELNDLLPMDASVPMVSTVTGALVTEPVLDARYWGRNLRDPVLFRQAICALIADGHQAFLEIAPHPLLGAQIRQMAPGAIVVSPLRRGTADAAVLRAALAPLAGERRGERPRHLLLLSALTSPALDALAQSWADRLPQDWPDLCHTALIGREHFPWRLALHAASGEEAQRRLLAGEFQRGHSPATPLTNFDQRRGEHESWGDWLDRCAAAFLEGADIDPVLFEAGEPWCVVDAPTYGFQRERHWLPQPDAGLSYTLEWEPYAPSSAAPWPVTEMAADPPDPGLEVEATRFARGALASVSRDAITPRLRQLAERLAAWTPMEGPPAADGPPSRMLRRVGEALPDILTGRTDPLEVLFPGGSLEIANVYGSPPFAAAQRALAHVIGALGDRPLRVLELGAGTGALTALLLPALPPGSELTSSDVSAAFLTGLRQRFPDSPMLHTAVLDIDKPAGVAGPFDAIVAANVLHAGANLGNTLRALRSLLAPGGVLGLVELTRAPRWIDLVFGVTDGWWRFRGDPLRAEHALLDPAAWTAVLEAEGFVDIQIRPDGDTHAMILCRSPAAQQRWRLAGSGSFGCNIPAADAPTGLLYCPGDQSPEHLAEEVSQLAACGLPLSVVADQSVPHAAVVGAARALSLERPNAVAAVFELADKKEATHAAVRDALGRTGVEDQIRAVDGALTVARVVRTASSAPPPVLAGDRLYVVAGGLGRLGFACSRFLVQRGARHLLLIGRSPAEPGRLATLARDGATARYIALDLTRPSAAAAVAAAIDRPLGGVVHAVGLAEGPAEQVFAAKLRVAEALEKAAQGHEPSFFLLFSSAAGIWGTRGHVAYAAASRALDRWAEQARSRGLPATAIAFGRFKEPGLLSKEEDAALAASGLTAMAPDAALLAAFQAIAENAPHRIVAGVDWPRFRATFEARRRRPLFDRLAPKPTAPRSSTITTSNRPVASNTTLDRTALASIVAEVLGQDDPARLDPDRGLFEQGLDSLMAVTLRQRLEDTAGVPVPAAVLFAHPTLSLLAGWLAGTARHVPATATAAPTGREPIAIVGLGCRFPGGICGPRDFLPALRSGCDALREIPAGRKDFAAWHAARSAIASPLAGFLDDVDRFDAAFFGISPREAAQLDPQQRLLLEVAWEALEHAGIAPDRLNGSRAGVFIGATGSDYATLARRSGQEHLDAHSLLGQPGNTLAGRLAYQFGLHGPALTVDTACSSSLVALHLAVRALRQGEADLALAGGVNLLLAPDTSVILTRAGLLSPGGHCKVFDATADGYVRGEGCGVAVLKPLSQARREGDRVLAVIRGSAVNHDGHSSSFTAPNGAAQAAVIRDALADAAVRPEDIDYVEAHGTGTALGDPIEFDALSDVFADRAQPLPIGSIKANIGHTEAAAGIAGVIKAVACLDAGILPPQAHFQRLNPHVAKPEGPVRVVAREARLPDGARRAGVSAFGASGTNAHIVLEHTGEQPEVRGEGPARLFLSAATPEGLAALRTRVEADLSAGIIDFADACHTAWIGRARLPCWLVADDVSKVATALPQTGTPPELAPPRGRRVSLPGTPFGRRSYWLEVHPAIGLVDRHARLGKPHRSARSGEEVWEGRLDPAAAWLRDHVVDGIVLLPAAGFLDMAVSAGLSALRDVVFHSPLEVPAESVAIQLVRDATDNVGLYAETQSGWSEIASARAATPGSVEPFGSRTDGLATWIEGDEFSRELVRRGFGFGPAYRTITRLARDGMVAEATIGLGPDAGPWLDPMLIDAAIQTVTALLPESDMPWLPARIAFVAFGGAPGKELTARARLREAESGRAIADAVLEREDGLPLLLLQGLELRPAESQPGAWLHDVVWRPAGAIARRSEGCWHAIGAGVGALHVASSDESGAAPVPIEAAGVIDLRPLTAATPHECLWATTALVRRLAALASPPQLVLVSRGASAAAPVRPGDVPPAAVLMGLQPVIEAEHPALRCRWIDLDPDDPVIPTALAGDAGRYAIRNGHLLTPEIVKAPPQPAGPVRLTPGPDRSYADLRLVPDAGTPPGPGEVQIEVAAAGLNFKDALAAVGQAPGPAEPLGLECAGRVLTTGPGVAGLSPGDPVFAFGRGALASRVTLPASQVLRRPDWLDEDSAASLPVAMLTAWHGLHDIAVVRPGMRVLIHAAAGGVGSAAVGLAKLAGARVFATASAGKQSTALALGAEAVADSRSAQFAGPARRWAGPGGFDIVLHALGPEMAAASAELLRPGGIFLEIGNAKPPPGLHGRHAAYDLDQPMRADPGWFADTMSRILPLLRDDVLVRPNKTVLPLARAGEALQSLGQGRTTGKLVLHFPAPPPVRPDASYLVTGGSGVVGRALAGWLADAGAGRVVLASRHATRDPRFETAAVDVSDRAALAALLQRLPDLRGVIHAAGVVRDRTLAQLTEEEVQETLAPKVEGARNLDELTRETALDFFLLVSSSSGTIGSPGQAAYAGANAWLDRLAAGRRAAGLPTLAIGSGPWRGGMFERLDPALRSRLERSGFRPMAPRRAAAAFFSALGSGVVHRLVMDRIPPAHADAPADLSIRATLLAASPAERAHVLQTELAHRIIALLGFPQGTRIDADRPLRDLGLDSLLSVSLRNEVAAATGLSLPTTIAFDLPTLRTLSAHLLALLDEPPAPLEALDETELATLLDRELELRP